MRSAFISTLTELAKRNKDIFLLTADLGFSVLENFKDEFSGRFYNVGVAEANMAGIAAGLALSGKTVFIYSIVPFATMRCFEQIRNDICYQDLNVRIVGVGGGFSYGSAGMTHYAFEDISLMRSLFNMTVICPGDPLETRLAVKESLRRKGPIYIRIGKGGDALVHTVIEDFKIGSGITIYTGRDLTIIATGNMLNIAKQVSDRLREENLSVRFISMHTIKPIDRNLIINAASQTKAIFTLEEHSIIGGLGSAVAEVLAEQKNKVKFMRFGLLDKAPKEVGSHDYLRQRYGLDTGSITRNILKKL